MGGAITPSALAGRAPASAIRALGDRRRDAGPPAGAPADHDLRARAERFLLTEARLLDTRRFEDWLALWRPEGLFWMPLDPERHDSPAVHQSLVLDDLRRLGERVERLRSRAAWSQQPPTRTLRHLGNVEAWDDGDAVEVRSVLTLHAHRDGMHSLVSGRQEHRLVPRDGDGSDQLLIEVKVLDLLDADAAHPNLSYLL